MKNMKTFLLIGCLALGCAFLTSKAKAGEWDQKTILTFDQPVELPGNVVLPAGTYVFKLIDSPEDRNIVQVLSQDEQKVYATIHAMPDFREHATGETTIVYQKGPAGAPRAIKEWFFPDRRYGHEFVYSKAELANLAKADEPEMAEHSEQTGQSEENSYSQPPDWTEPVELAKADEPESENKPAESSELNYLQAQDQKQMEEPQREPAPIQTAMGGELPKTASRLPLLFLSGMLLVGISFGLRRFSKTH